MDYAKKTYTRRESKAKHLDRRESNLGRPDRSHVVRKTAVG